ncbi:MAG: hypothetical protein WD557_03550 [Dehalococcoidia bacterium]
MAAPRRTVSAPRSIVDEVAAEAEERGVDFWTVVAERLAARRGPKLSIEGIISAEPDLSLKVEELFRERSDSTP